MRIARSARMAYWLTLAFSGVSLMTQSSAAADKPDTAPIVAAANSFGMDLYQKFSEKPGNVFFSPYSISSALTMTQRGARGATADEMAMVLHLPATGVDESSKALMSQLKGNKDANGFDLTLANALWLQASDAFNQDYLTLTHDTFHAGLEALDFVHASEPSRITINNWVATQTHDKIKDLLPKGSVTPMTQLVLTNAVYFKGGWETPFKKNATDDADFTHLDGAKTTVSMMHARDRHGYMSDENKAAIELTYKGNDISMLVILPAKTDAAALKAMEASLTEDGIRKIRADLKSQPVVLSLPKWKMTESYNLGDTLKSLGMKLAFGKADFSGINGRSDLSISAVIHKAFIEVNEEGTEAAAATGVVMVGAMAMPHPEQPVVFNADHPFVYAIIHRPTGTILFMGRVEDPAK